MVASAECPSQAGVDIIVGIVHDYGWRLLAGGKVHLRALRWPRLLPGESGMQPVLALVASWDQALRSMLNSPTAGASVRTLLCCHEACNDVWQDLWSQRCEGGCVPSWSILPLVCSGCVTTVLVWVHKCASTLLCEPCRERAGKWWPKARWALRHSGQMSLSAWKMIGRDLREMHVDGERSPDDPSAVLPLLLLWAALYGDSRILWL